MSASGSSPSPLSFRQSLALTALTASILTSGIILSYQALRREHRTERLKKEVGEDVEEWEKRRAGSGSATPEERLTGSPGSGQYEEREREWARGEFDESLIREQLTRNYNFLGEDSMAKVRQSRVVVVGCGGVGSWCALMLLRSGVSNLLLIDFDMTTLSSLNRHACATLEDVGSPKVIAMQKYFKKVAPWARVDIHVGLWRKEDSTHLLEGADYVVDAIDNIDTKVDLLAHCALNKIPVFSSMGSGAKRDPTRIQIADISMTYEDPLARKVRQRLRMLGVHSGVPVVYSTETPSDVKLLPLPDEEFAKGKVTELSAFDDFRVRILPVLGPLPAIFGLNIATYIILSLAGKPLTEYQEIKLRRKLYQDLERRFTDREIRWQGLKAHEQNHDARAGMNWEDTAFVFEDLYNGRSSLPPNQVLVKPSLVRWRKEEKVSAINTVVMDAKSADKHEKEVLKGGKSVEEVWGEEACRFIARKQEEAVRILRYRRG